MQITHNGIKWMTWFLAACNKYKLQPTFKLFHQLFSLVKSSVRPLYELQFRAAECGFDPGLTKPVMQKASLKHWNKEVILLKGLDLFYIPYIGTEGMVTEFKRLSWREKPSNRFMNFVHVSGPNGPGTPSWITEKCIVMVVSRFSIFVVRTSLLKFCIASVLTLFLTYVFAFFLFQAFHTPILVTSSLCLGVHTLLRWGVWVVLSRPGTLHLLVGPGLLGSRRGKPNLPSTRGPGMLLKMWK